jgi:hypothetical protein
VPDNSFSDLLSGYIYALPPGVPDHQERLFLAGKIGGRRFIEKTKPVCPDMYICTHTHTHTHMHTLSLSLLSLSRASLSRFSLSLLSLLLSLFLSLMYTYVYLQFALTVCSRLARVGLCRVTRSGRVCDVHVAGNSRRTLALSLSLSLSHTHTHTRIRITDVHVAGVLRRIVGGTWRRLLSLVFEAISNTLATR